MNKSSATGGLVSGLVSTALNGSTSSEALKSGLISGVTGGITGGLMGGIIGGLSVEKGASFWNGEYETGTIIENGIAFKKNGKNYTKSDWDNAKSFTDTFTDNNFKKLKQYNAASYRRIKATMQINKNDLLSQGITLGDQMPGHVRIDPVSKSFIKYIKSSNNYIGTDAFTCVAHVAIQ